MPTWRSGPAATSQEVNMITPSRPIAYLHMTASDSPLDLSKPLDTSRASRLDLTFIPDADQTTATPSGTVSVYAHPGGVQYNDAAPANLNGLPEISADYTGDGIQDDTPMDGITAGLRGLRDFAVPAIVAEVGAAPAGSEKALLVVIGQFSR